MDLQKHGKNHLDIQEYLVDHTNRQRLLGACMNRGLLQNTILQIIEPMVGKSHEERERIAAELLPRVEAGEFDTEERTDYSLDRR